MTPERWHRFKDVVGDLLTTERREWPERLFATCGDDVDLFLDASATLAASRSIGDFIEVPAWRTSRPAPGSSRR